MTLKTKLVGGLAMGAMMAGVLLPSGAFASTVTVSGNGAGSKNHVKLVTKNSTVVSQSNSAYVVNSVGVSQNTGGNKANKNVGGDVSVTSGNATSTVTNTTTTGDNVVVANPCGCAMPDATVKIKGNGAGSYNNVKVVNSNSSVVYQVNMTSVVNGVNVSQNNGDNHAKGNVGGDVDVTSGDAMSTVTNTVTTGGNVLTPSM